MIEAQPPGLLWQRGGSQKLPRGRGKSAVVPASAGQPVVAQFDGAVPALVVPSRQTAEGTPYEAVAACQRLL